MIQTYNYIKQYFTHTHPHTTFKFTMIQIYTWTELYTTHTFFTPTGLLGMKHWNYPHEQIYPSGECLYITCSVCPKVNTPVRVRKICLLWVLSLIHVAPVSLLRCIQHRVKLRTMLYNGVQLRPNTHWNLLSDLLSNNKEFILRDAFV